MKFRYSVATILLFVGLTIVTVGCSDGGGGSSTPKKEAISTAPEASTSVSGLTGTDSTGDTSSESTLSRKVDASTEGSATLVVDINNNGSFDDSEDVTYTTPIEGGHFSFENIAVDKSEARTALLTVSKEGFAPYHQVLELNANKAITVMAKVNKPILKEVIDISGLSETERASSFVQFGTQMDGKSLKAFSKLLSLSEFSSMSDVNLSNEGTQSNSIIPVGAFPSSVEKVTVSMQSFNSSDPEDFAAFPGKLSGHGKTTQRATEDDEVALESAGFDLLELNDQDGNKITLQPLEASKLSILAGREVCGGMQWTRHLYPQEVEVIKSWGDDDNDSSNGYQVPIWSNDNATGSWRYVALATVENLDGTNPYFSVCVDQEWEGYLNCDSPLATSRPQQMCVSVTDQNANPMSGVYIAGRKGGKYSTAYSQEDGRGILEIKDANITGWTYTYNSALTGWSNIEINPSEITESSNQDCDYELNIMIENPYTTQMLIKAYAMDDDSNSTPLTNASIHVYNYDSENYFSKYVQTDSDGVAAVLVKPNVLYTVSYKAGKTEVNTGDLREVEVAVKDENRKPEVYLNINSSNISDTTKKLKFSLSASDANNDAISFIELKINDTLLQEGVDYTLNVSNSYDGYYYAVGEVNLDSALLSTLGTSLAASDSSYTLLATVSDSKDNVSNSKSFTVRQNSAPSISSLYLKNSVTGYSYYSGSNSIASGEYIFNAYVYDPDGDAYNVTYTLDGNEINASQAQALDGDYTVTVTAKDINNNSSSKEFSFHAGNHAPVLSSYGTTDAFVTPSETFRLYAYASDSDNDELNVTATANGKTFSLTRSGNYGAYRSDALSLSSVVDVDASEVLFSIVVSDGTVQTQAVSVRIVQNQAPSVSITTNATDIDDSTAVLDVNTGEAIEFACNASDPEGAMLMYSWSVDGNPSSSITNRLSISFSQEDQHTVTCTVRDRDGASASASLTLNSVGSNTDTTNSALKNALVSQTVYSAIDNRTNTMESWVFNSDFTAVTVVEMVGGTSSDTYSITSYTDNSFTIEDDDSSQVQIVLISTENDYAIVKIGDIQQRVYFDEVKAREYFLTTTDPVTNNTELQETVESLLAPEDNADVNDAKYLFTQLREVSETFIDLENDENSSTIIGYQNNVLESNIKPAVEDIADDLEESVDAFDSCLGSFSDSIVDDFNATMEKLTNRLEDFTDLVEKHEDENSWSETSDYGDKVVYKYTKVGDTVTEEYSINDMNISTTYEDLEDDTEVKDVHTNGSIELHDTMYDIKITKLNLNGTDAEFNMEGFINGDNSASMVLSKLSIVFKIDNSKETPFDFFQDIAIDINGTTKAGGRELVGTLTLDDSNPLNNKLIGTMKCLDKEPSFEGEVLFNMSLSSLRQLGNDAIREGESDWYNDVLLMATFEDGQKSLVTNMKIERSDNEDDNRFYSYYTMHTQRDMNISCTAYDDYNETTQIFRHVFGCNDNVVLTPYSFSDKIVEVTTEDGDKNYIEAAWWDYQWTDNITYLTLNVEIVDDEDVQYNEQSQILEMGDSEWRVADITSRPILEPKDFNFDINFKGVFKDGDKLISATIGLNNVLSSRLTSIYAQNLKVEDGSVNYLYATELFAGFLPEDFKSIVEDDEYEDEFSLSEYSEYSSYEYKEIYYEEYYEDDSDDEEFENLDKLQILRIDGLEVSVTDKNGEALTMSGTVSYRLNDKNTSLSFEGDYSYDGTHFKGIAEGWSDEATDSLSANLLAEVSASGYEPFSLDSSVSIANSIINGYVLFSRGTEPSYNLGMKITGDLDDEANLTIGDSNGVIGSYTIVEDSNQSFSMEFTDKDGNNLANVGEASTGNSWEIQYSDGSSETLY